VSEAPALVVVFERLLLDQVPQRSAIELRRFYILISPHLLTAVGPNRLLRSLMVLE
jgi:hypothetical protein